MAPYEILMSRIRQVRRRWRFQSLFKGIAVFLASTILLLLLGVWGGEIFGFKPAAVWTMRVLTLAAVLAGSWYFLYIPFRRRIPDIQIAQFIEEQYPHLEERLVTAVEYGDPSDRSTMIDLLIKDALRKMSRVEISIFLNRKRLVCLGLLGVTSFAVLFALLSWGPAFFPFGFHRLYTPWAEASPDLPMRIDVVPGDIEILKGSDQKIEAQLVGFDAPNVHLQMQPEGGDVWNPIRMEPKTGGGDFHYLLIDIQSPMRYFVEARGVRSESYSIRVVDLAKVEQIDLTYNFPKYTGMSPKHVENTGDITALKGTEVDLAIRFDQPVRSAHLLLDDQKEVQLAPSDSKAFSGRLVLERSGSYIVQVEELNGKSHEGSSEYLVEVLEDALPVITIVRPMRDVRATNVEEVFSEIKAEDDMGIGRLELVYSVNGESETTVALFDGKTDEKSVLRSHTFFLEELGLVPGDLVSYYARGADNNSVSGPGVSSSDIYFIQIRPFENRYVQSQQSPNMQGSESEQEEGESLSPQQKDIISATHNLIRDKDSMPREEYREGLQTLALVQDRLLDQTQELVGRMQRRDAVQSDDDFIQLSEYLENAVVEMEKAATELRAEKPESAFPPEQKSLQQLMRAESLFREIQVSLASQSSSSGSGSQSNSEDLADLFELEMDKLKNQYETMQSGEREQRDQEVDEALERLKELARRQQQINERNRMMARQGDSPQASSGGSSAANQQQLLEQAEELQRQLQRLSRERSSPRLDEARNRIQRAIEEMKQALNESRNNNSSEASARGMRALEQLQDAMRRLDLDRQSDLSRQLQQAVDESGELVKEQDRIQRDIGQMSEEAASSDFSPGRTGQRSEDTGQRGEDIVDRKELLADRLDNLETNIRNLARQARKTQQETSDKLSDAASEVRDRRLTERILSGNEMIRSGNTEFQQEWENYIREGLEDLNRQLQSARESMVDTGEDTIEAAANRARQLAEGLESLQQQIQDRMQEEQRAGAAGEERTGQQQGQSSQAQMEGESGQQGQQEQAQANQGRGQQGQQGQQEQAQANQGRGQQGQQGRMPSQADRGQGQQGRSGREQSMVGRNGDPSRSMSPGQRMPENQMFLPGGVPSPDMEVRTLSSDATSPPRGTSSRAERDARQLQSEFEQRLRDARDLRNLLGEDSNRQDNLDNVVDLLRKAGDYTDYSDPERIAFLKAAIESMRRIELGLARDLDRLTQDERYFSAEGNEAPADYQELVEEYYRSIAKGR